MNEIECPECNTLLNVEDFSSGECACGAEFYWDDDWDYIAEMEGCPGFYWHTA